MAPESALPASWSDSSAVSKEREEGRVPTRPNPARLMVVTRPEEEHEMPLKEQASPPAVLEEAASRRTERGRRWRRHPPPPPQRGSTTGEGEEKMLLPHRVGGFLVMDGGRRWSANLTLISFLKEK
ncbi:hypothetical protein SEVIR_3G337780v4 [Setaria viridis]